MTQATTDLNLYLASRSPRRRELLDQIEMRYALIDIDVDETPQPGEAPADYVQRLAIAKSLAGVATLDAGAGVPVLGADTTVTFDDEILGKPENRAHAREMLESLSGRTHEVVTAIALSQSDGATHSAISRTRVQFRTLYTAEIDAYWDTGEPCDKAGAYAIQGRGGLFVERIEGSYSGVVGLPLFEFGELMKRVQSQT